AMSAAVTERMWVGPLVSPVALRHPVLIAKHAATVDRISGGRLLLALGAGWNRPEFESFGFTFDESFAIRAEKLKEGVEVILRLFAENGWVDFAGKHYRLAKAPFWPKPVQRPRPPLWFGGGGTVIRELVARAGDGWCPAAQHYKGFTPEVYAQKLADIRERAKAAGRDPRAVTPAITFLTSVASSRQQALDACSLMRKRPDWSDLTLEDMERRGVIVLGTPEECAAGVSRYVEAGARYIILHIMPYDLKAAERAIEMYAKHILPRFA
ncbi:MAG: LLM class flavin-dependent oxidoreductase, partial [Nitrospinota bacterium]